MCDTHDHHEHHHPHTDDHEPSHCGHCNGQHVGYHDPDHSVVDASDRPGHRDHDKDQDLPTGQALDPSDAAGIMRPRGPA